MSRELDNTKNDNQNNVFLHPEAKEPANAPLNNRSAGFGGSVQNKLKIFIPAAVVLMCAIITVVLLRFEIADLNSIHGKFVCSTDQESNSYISFNDNGQYTFIDSVGAEKKGTWENSGDTLILRENGASPVSAFFVEGKYIAFDDEDFLSGSVPDESVFDASFTSGDGTTYVFDKDGKCYTADEGRNTELGKYITDGCFIVVTIDNVAYTYLNCGDGIAPVFYTQS